VQTRCHHALWSTGISLPLGPGQGQPAISDTTALTVTAANNVTVTGDILYNTPPVTLTQNQVRAHRRPPLVPGSDHGQVLGIFTAKGDIQLNNTQSNGNLEIDASLATISQGGTGGLVNVGKSINHFRLSGPHSEQHQEYQYHHPKRVLDRRFAQNNFSRRWYPSTTLACYCADLCSVRADGSASEWINNTSYY